MTSTVAIFRKRLLSYSETFIADQGRLLPTYRPVFCGYHRDNTGLQLLKGSDKLLLDDHSSLGSLSKFLLRHGLGGGKRWIRAIANETPAIIHAHFFNDGIDAVKIGSRLDLPVITTVHGHDITKHQNAQAGQSVNRQFFEQVDQVIAVSDFIAEQALAKGCPENKLVQHYIGIDLEKFSQPKQESEQPSLLFVGRLVEKKGCTYLLQAMSLLEQRFPELQLTIVGSGDLDSQLRQEVAERQLNVVFAGTAKPSKKMLLHYSAKRRTSPVWLKILPPCWKTRACATIWEGLGASASNNTSTCANNAPNWNRFTLS